MFIVSAEANAEIQNRKAEYGKEYVRLQMRHSCYMKVKLTFEDEILPNDVEEVVDGVRFIIDKGHEHYFFNKKIVYGPDKFGFKEFDLAPLEQA
ncbi:iron-sulfur cluster biosynthesis [Niallia oryzisoli]|uniref:iron-sulfur cluster biosynthesis n=1 Tax=Niallia oryzisoli TaxID=1737571 RepID=UPI0037355F0E